MNNLTQTQQDVKQTFFSNYQFEIFNCFENSNADERNAIIKHIDAFLSDCNSEQQRFWRNIKRKLNSISGNSKEKLIFKPKAWTQKTLEFYGIEDEEKAEREKFEKQLPKLQKIWKETVLENLKKEQVLLEKLTISKKVNAYIWKAVKEATLTALSGILNRDAPDETEKLINWALMTPNDSRPFRFVRLEEETQSDFSFCNLMLGAELPDGKYNGKIKDIQIKPIEDKSDINYRKDVFIFIIQITEDEFDGQIAKIPVILNPFHLEVRMGNEMESQRILSNAEFSKRLKENLENAGAVAPFTNETLTAQIPILTEHIVKIEISRNGMSAKFEKLFE